MTLAPRSPMRELEAFRDRVNRMLADLEGMPAEWRESSAVPVDMKETDDDITVRATMPGIKPEDVDINIRNGVLHLRGTSQEEREEKEGTWHRRERRFGRVERSLTLPAPVDIEKTEAELVNGVLAVTMPKMEPTPHKRISVKSG